MAEKKLPASADLKRSLIEPSDRHLSMRGQCELIGLNRSSYYLAPTTESEENPRLMRLIDQQFLRTPFHGGPRMTASLTRSGETVSRKRAQRLMALMGLEAIFPKPRTTVAAPDARAYPYLLRARVLTHVNEVWSSDITYVPIRHGFMYLTAVIDWFSRYVLSWRPSNTLEGRFRQEALDEALSRGRPEIFHADQGSQSITGPLARSIGPEFTRAERGKGLTNTDGLSGPSLGVHYSRKLLPRDPVKRQRRMPGGAKAIAKTAG